MIRKIIEFSVRRSTVTEVVVTEVVTEAVTGVDTEVAVGLDPVDTEVPIRVLGVVGEVAVTVGTVGAGTAGVTPGRGTVP